MAVLNNQARLTYGDNETVYSNAAAGSVVEPLRITKGLLNKSYRAGDTITYIVNLRNTGVTPLTGLTVTDDLGETSFGEPARALYPLTFLPDTLQYYVAGVQQTAPVPASDEPLVITGVNVPAGSNAQLIYQAQVNEFAPMSGTEGVTNEVTVTGAGLMGDVTASVQVEPNASPVLAVNKAVDPAEVVPNQPMTYTYTITNTGTAPADAAENIVLTDTLDPVLRLTDVTLDGAPLTSGTDYTYDANGNFATTAGRITVPAATITQDETTGAYAVTPGTAVLRVTGTM